MVASMTAFGRASGQLADWEIRSVNHRYLELNFRLPEPLRELEQPLRELTASRVRRGKLDATLRLAGSVAARPRLNKAALKQLITAVKDIDEQTDHNQIVLGHMDPLDLMRWPGILEDDQRQLAKLKDAVLADYRAAMDDLVAHRRREGANLDTLLRARLANVERIGAATRELTAGQGAALRERLRRRVDELTSRLDAKRLEQEVALLVQKADVAEELDRLDIHVIETRASLDSDKPCGRRLDFLMQELGREANTLAAKSVLPQAARLAVDLKVTIEQLREQAQNVE